MAKRKPRPQKAPRFRWQTRTPQNQKPSVVVVGMGRVGGALALGLRKANWPVKVFPRSGESTRRAARLNLALADHQDLLDAELCILAVPDAALPRVAQSLREDFGPRTALVHCAGAMNLEAFGDDFQSFPRGSFHPLCAISDPTDELKDHSVAIASSHRALTPLLWRMALALRLKPLEVSEEHRALYHAGAVMSAGLAVSLLSTGLEALERAGIAAESAEPALLALMRSALDGVERRGLGRAMTGPVVRGDLAVVASHLSALPEELSETYRVLSLRALRLVEKTLPRETVHGLSRLLERR